MERQRGYRKADPDRIRALDRAAYARNWQQKADYRAANKETLARRKAEWLARNREEINARRRAQRAEKKREKENK